MKKRARHFTARSIAGQSGNALILVLVFLLLGSLILVPVLDQLGTALKTGVRYEKKTDALYAADSGIEDGIWQVKYDGLQTLFGGEDSYDYNFTTNASYNLDSPVNGLTTHVTIQNVWIPSNVTLGDLGLSADDAKTIIDSEKLMVSGTSGALPGQPYRIMIQFVPATGDNLTIKSVGVWLPQGFTFVSGNSSLEQSGHPYTKIPTVSDHCGGQAIVWSYDSPYPLFTSFPNFVSENGTLTSTIAFSYTPPPSDDTRMPAAISWVTTEMADALGNPVANPNSPVNVPISWDVDTRIYKISSKAGDTRVEAYSSKRELRDLNDAMSGDYVAIGNSLMDGDVTKRDHLIPSSSTSVANIPADADVISAYLYWSGFRLATSIFSDDCSNNYYWDRGNQTRVPTADSETSGTWSATPASPATYWDKVDETSANDNDYITGNVTASGNYYKLLNFSPFTVPAGSTITDITIYFRAKDNSSGTNNIQAYIKAGGSYSSAGSVNPGSSWNTNSYSFTTNPKTGSAWTVADINGTGTNPLQGFGVYSSDLNPAVDVSMVYAAVNVSRWTISSGQFQGQGSTNATAPRTITLKNSLDLSSYAPGTVALYWNQGETGTLESDDTLYFALSSDGGSTWSNDIEAFHDDNPASPIYYLIPDAYKTGNFKVRFYFNFNASDEYVYLDNIKVINMPPDTSVNFSINGQQVYLDASNNPQAGAQPLTASSGSILINTAGVDSDKQGYSFACHRDVSKLVKKYPVVPGETHHTGNANYTVGDVQADTGQYVSYAGWSLIIVYFSPETAGHYLYLRDVFAFNPGGTNLDFDGDGQPGGDITGFVIPEPIRDRYGALTETVAAGITCFVGEGDAIYTGDSLKITGQQSLLNKYLSNSASPWDNIWNGASPGVSNPGIDVDSFQVLWTDNILMPNDTRFHLDMNSGTDAWNFIYVVVSVRSKTVVGGTEHYIILDE